eukprot:TRINITY_DN3475_c1_g1_i1.p1 TRINITY_DN3475_c1_g1~~TRINITY_DN3475_c1_g1_i1.p1  ORF type:complete len:509 (+),score=59.41 TRINITY_DN3475_c1_g1_i1:86-1528(+)
MPFQLTPATVESALWCVTLAVGFIRGTVIGGTVGLKMIPGDALWVAGGCVGLWGNCKPVAGLLCSVGWAVGEYLQEGTWAQLPLWPNILVFLSVGVWVRDKGLVTGLLLPSLLYFMSQQAGMEFLKRVLTLAVICIPCCVKFDTCNTDNRCEKAFIDDDGDEEEGFGTQRYPSLTNLRKKINLASEYTPETDILFPQKISTELDSEWCVSKRTLGRGCFGEVLLGVSKKERKFVAVKTQFLTNYTPPSSRRKARRNTIEEKINLFVNEVTLLSTLRHDNVVAYLGSGVSGQYLYVVLEYLSGGTLADVIEKFEKLPDSCLKGYMNDVTSGLAFLHGRSVVHRDLKPVNILLTAEGKCKLADFGAATSVCVPTLPAGTPFYMSPEACSGRACSSSDIWSLGVIAYQLFLATLPFSPQVMSFPEIFNYRLQNLKPEVLPCISPALAAPTPHLHDFLKSCLAIDPEERCSASELLLHPFMLQE